MVELQVGECRWLFTSAWEANQSTFVDFPSVLRHHSAFFAEMYPKRKIEVVANSLSEPDFKVYYLCGSDHALKCRLQRG